jgi:hypothetical protein
MDKTHISTLKPALLLGACMAFAACGSSSSNDASVNADASGNADAAVAQDAAPHADAAPAADAATGLDALGSMDATTTSTPSCAHYCTTIQANCTGNNQQYSSMTTCMQSCKAIPAGSISDQSGNTLGCRIYHAGAAAAGAMLHCPHAGPGGDGTCGAVCDGYCQLAEKYCVPPYINMAIYTSAMDCQTTCGMFRSDLRYNTSIQTGMEKACLVYHAQEASAVPPDHCLGDLVRTATLASTTCHD